MKEILGIIHKTIYQFFDVCEDDEEVPISENDKLLLEVNKAICNNLKALEQQPCEDAVSREAVKEQMIKYGYLAPDMTVTEFVEGLPSVTPTRPNGEWIINKDKDTVCSNCEEPIFKYQKVDFDYRPHFCPNCGADMRGDADGIKT